MRMRTLPALAGAMVAVLTAAACGDQAMSDDVVARADDYRLTVDQVVNLLVDEEALPAEGEVLEVLANLWIDYTLLADAVARDSTLDDLDLEPMIRQQLNQDMILQLRDSVIQVDTVLTEEDLRAFYAENADARVRARHILMGYPPQATQAQRDSVRAQMQALLNRIRAGADFAALARDYSQDQGSAAQGGDLGFFSRGELLRPVEEAAFQMEPGEVSGIVESPYGLHIIKVEGRERPEFEDVRDQVAQQALTRRALSAESLYVASVEERVNPEVAEGAVELVREVAREPSARITNRAADRALVSYDGGAYTVGELRAFLQSQQEQFRANVVQAPDEQIENLLRGMAQRDILVAEAGAAGLEPPRQRVDSILDWARGQLLGLATRMGLRELDRAPGEPLEQAVSRAALESVEKVVTGATDVVPLGPVAFQLRERANTAINDAGVGRALLRIAEVRASRSPGPAETPPDTSGAGGG